MWNKFYNNGAKYNQNSNCKILEIINSTKVYIKENIHILDIGCGAGELSVILSEHGYKVTGIDISDVAIVKARRLNEDRNTKVNFLVSDIFQIEGKFDIILCKLVFAFIEDKEVFLDKIKCLMNANSSFIISTPIITLENKEKVLKPAICITVQDIEDLKKHFSKVSSVLENQDNFGDNYIITCSI